MPIYLVMMPSMLCESDKQAIFADSDYDELRALLGRRSFKSLVDVFRGSSKADFNFFFGSYGVFTEQLQFLQQETRHFPSVFAGCLSLLSRDLGDLRLQDLLDPAISFHAAVRVPYNPTSPQERRRLSQYYKKVMCVMDARKRLGVPANLPASLDLYDHTKALYRMLHNRLIRDRIEDPDDIDACRARGELMLNAFGGDLLLVPPEPGPGAEAQAYQPSYHVRRVGFLQRQLEASPGNTFRCQFPPSRRDVSAMNTVLRLALRYARRRLAIERALVALPRMVWDQRDVLKDYSKPLLPQLRVLQVFMRDLLLRAEQLGELRAMNAAIACVDQALDQCSDSRLKAIYTKLLTRMESIARQSGCLKDDKSSRLDCMPKNQWRSLKVILKHVHGISAADFPVELVQWLQQLEPRFISAANIKVLQYIGFARLSPAMRVGFEQLGHRFVDDKSMSTLLLGLPAHLLTSATLKALANVSVLTLQDSKYAAKLSQAWHRLGALPNSTKLVGGLHWTWWTSQQSVTALLAKSNDALLEIARSGVAYCRQLPMVNLSRHRLLGSFPLPEKKYDDAPVSVAPKRP